MTGLRVEMDREGEIDLEIPLEMTETLQLMGPSTQMEMVPGSQMMLPKENLIELSPPVRTLVRIKRGSSLGWLKNWAHDSNTVNLNSPLVDRPEKYTPDVTGTHADVGLAGGNVEGVLKSAEEISRVDLVAGDYIWPVKVEAKGKGSYRLSGKLTAPAASAKPLKISSLVVNGSTLIELPKPINLNTRSAEVSHNRTEKVFANVGAGWVDVGSLKNQTLKNLRLRIAVGPGFGRPYQAHAEWTMPRLIFWKGQKLAERHDEVTEVVSAPRLKRVEEQGQVWIEFDSREIFNARPEDSLERVLGYMSVIDDSGNSVDFSNRSETFRDRPFFKVLSCEKLLTP
jgi:hypothetical protein